MNDELTKAYLKLISENYDESFYAEKNEEKFFDENFEKDPDLDDVWVKIITEPDVKLIVKKISSDYKTTSGYELTILNGEMQIASVKEAKLASAFKSLFEAVDKYMEDLLEDTRKTLTKKYARPLEDLEESLAYLDLGDDQ